MRKEYSGLNAVVIPMGSNSLLTTSTCHSIWESHMDENNNQVCDAIEDGFTATELANPSTQAWSDCEVGHEPF